MVTSWVVSPKLQFQFNSDFAHGQHNLLMYLSSSLQHAMSILRSYHDILWEHRHGVNFGFAQQILIDHSPILSP